MYRIAFPVALLMIAASMTISCSEEKSLLSSNGGNEAAEDAQVDPRGRDASVDVAIDTEAEDVFDAAVDLDASSEPDRLASDLADANDIADASDVMTEPETDDPLDPGMLGYIGSACEDAGDCPYDGSLCVTEDEGYPLGMCSFECTRICPDSDGFPTTFCIDDPYDANPLCHSRCDYEIYPTVGCRDGYMCRVLPRHGEPDTNYGTCIPEDSMPEEDLSDCLQWLVDNGVLFERTTYAPRHPEGNTSLTCTVEDPVRLHSPVAGVNYRYYYDDPGDYGSMLVACPMARAIFEASQILHDEFDVTEALHVGTTVCRVIAGSNRLSQHAYGTAIDYSGFFEDDGHWSGVYDHWEHETDDPVGYEAQLLYDVAHRWHEEHVFNYILTPNFNDAHDNHFHVDLTTDEWDILSLYGVTEPYYIGPNVYGD